MHKRIFAGFVRMMPIVALLVATPAFATPHELRIPLRDGKLHVADLAAAVCREVHLPSLHLTNADIDLRGWRGSLLLEGINEALGEGCSVRLSDDGLVLHVDPQKLPRTVEADKRALRTFVSVEAPEASAAQVRRWGLLMPAHVDASRPMVVLTHGLDCGMPMLQPMGELLKQQGFQVAYFCYPNDQPLHDSAQLLASHLAAVRETFPGMRVDIVAHSMGGLVARDYVEGDSYGGEVDHLILVGTPNDGSRWAKFHLLLKAQEGFEEWRFDPRWHASWIITSGLGEAARDITPHSRFLKQLTDHPRRQGVQYTVIAGTHTATARVAANWARALASAIPERAADWWVIGPARRGLEHEADKLRTEIGKCDGPVTVRSAKLAGVEDVVLLHADHCTLFYPVAGAAPAAFGTIVDRLER